MDDKRNEQNSHDRVLLPDTRTLLENPLKILLYSALQIIVYSTGTYLPVSYADTILVHYCD